MIIFIRIWINMLIIYNSLWWLTAILRPLPVSIKRLIMISYWSHADSILLSHLSESSGLWRAHRWNATARVSHSAIPIKLISDSTGFQVCIQIGLISIRLPTDHNATQSSDRSTHWPVYPSLDKLLTAQYIL